MEEFQPVFRGGWNPRINPGAAVISLFVLSPNKWFCQVVNASRLNPFYHNPFFLLFLFSFLFLSIVFLLPF